MCDQLTKADMNVSGRGMVVFFHVAKHREQDYSAELFLQSVHCARPREKGSFELTLFKLATTLFEFRRLNERKSVSS